MCHYCPSSQGLDNLLHLVKFILVNHWSNHLNGIRAQFPYCHHPFRLIIYAVQCVRVHDSVSQSLEGAHFRRAETCSGRFQIQTL